MQNRALKLSGARFTARLQVAPVETLPFDVFDRKHAADWAGVASAFGAEREEIEAAARPPAFRFPHPVLPFSLCFG